MFVQARAVTQPPPISPSVAQYTAVADEWSGGLEGTHSGDGAGQHRSHPIGRRTGSDAPPQGRSSSIQFHEAQGKGFDDPCSGRLMSTESTVTGASQPSVYAQASAADPGKTARCFIPLLSFHNLFCPHFSPSRLGPSRLRLSLRRISFFF